MTATPPRSPEGKADDLRVKRLLREAHGNVECAASGEGESDLPAFEVLWQRAEARSRETTAKGLVSTLGRSWLLAGTGLAAAAAIILAFVNPFNGIEPGHMIASEGVRSAAGGILPEATIAFNSGSGTPTAAPTPAATAPAPMADTRRPQASTLTPALSSGERVDVIAGYSETEWVAPTDFLLATPLDELLESTPRIDAPDPLELEAGESGPSQGTS